MALVTGGRIKIGFQIALKLLRAGCRVVVTTRFPRDAALRFARADGFDGWGARLNVYGLDLRDLPAIEAFCAHLRATLPRLDAIVNNACQTVRRPPAFYAHLMEAEAAAARALPDGAAAVLERNEAWQAGRGTVALSLADETRVDRETAAVDPGAGSEVTRSSGDGAGGGAGEARPLAFSALPSALQSQVPLAPGDDASPEEVAAAFPRGAVDAHGQQVDLRRQTSWTATLTQVSTVEVAECFAINSLAPFILAARLIPLMRHHGDGDGEGDGGDGGPGGASADMGGGALGGDAAGAVCRFASGRDADVRRGVCRCGAAARFIVNVSAMEGKFYRAKLPTHPHTNMGKAALNMLTRTSGPDLARRHICTLRAPCDAASSRRFVLTALMRAQRAAPPRADMTSVDTGWINDENPVEKARAHADAHNFQTPIDEVDAAARCVDPIFAALNSDAEAAPRDGGPGDASGGAETCGGGAGGVGGARAGSSTAKVGDAAATAEAPLRDAAPWHSVFLKDYHVTDW